MMRSRDALTAPEALVLTMVLVAAADGRMTDREIGTMSGLVQTLPAFHDFTTRTIGQVTEAAVEPAERGGRAEARRPADARRADPAAARDGLCPGLRGHRRRPGRPSRPSFDMLEFVRGELELDPLISAAIERGVRARHTRVE